MNAIKNPMVRGLALAAMVATGIGLLASATTASERGWGDGHRDDHHAARELVRSGEILPLRKVLDLAEGHQPGKVLEAEFEHDHGRPVYEVLILDDDGKVWELELDARDGRLLEMEH